MRYELDELAQLAPPKDLRASAQIRFSGVSSDAALVETSTIN